MRMRRTCAVIAVAFGMAFGAGAAFAATVSVGEAELNGDQLTIPVSLDEAASVEILIGAGGPKDYPAAMQQVVATQALAAGDSSVTVTIPVGAKISYAARTADSTSESREIISVDTCEYVWVNNAKGLWSDSNNWTRVSSDGFVNIGYPAYQTANIRFNGNQTADVTLDADYGKFGDLFIDNTGLNLTIRGNGHELKTGNTHCTSDNNFVFDHVRYTTGGSYTLGSRSTLRMINESYFQTEWEFNVNGTNAKLYVGPDSEIYCSNGYWYAFRLDGDGAEIVLEDGYIHGRAFRIGQNRNSATPTGIIFKGTHPRMDLLQEFVVCSAIPGNVVFEFYVPRGGYPLAPIRKQWDGDFIALDNRWLDHTSSTSVYTPVKFKVSPYSPCYQDEAVVSTCLFDWGLTDQGIKTSQAILEPTSTPTTDYLEFRTTKDDCEANQIWAVLTGTGTPSDLPVLGTATATADSSTGKVTLGAGVSNVSGDYETKLEVWACEAGPADAVELRKKGEVTVAEDGTASYEFDGKLGTKVHYKLVLVASNGTKSWTCGSTDEANVLLPDDHAHRYQWKNGASGVWSDGDNWTIEKDDAETRQYLEYPGYGANVGFYSTVSTITIDADYPQIHEIILGWGGADLTFRSAARDEATGAVTNAYTVETGGFRDGQYSNVKVTLDGVCFDTLGSTYPGSYSVKANSSLKMFNGATVRARWAVTVEGENAYMYIGTNCAVYASKAEPYHRIGLAGRNAEIVIDSGLLDGLFLAIGRDTDLENAPNGITFKGLNPRLALEDYMSDYRTGVYNALNGSPVFAFEIPETGYASTPVTRYGGNGQAFAQTTDGIPPIKVRVSEASPYLKVRTKFTQQLIDWSSANATPALNVDGVSLEKMPGSNLSRIYYTVETSENKSGVAAYCHGKSGLFFMVR